MCEDDQHIKLLKGLRGVIDAFYLDDKIKAEVQAEENTVKACGGITVCNLGYMEALKREKVICIVKDPRFRPPPKPYVEIPPGGSESFIMPPVPFPELNESNGCFDVISCSPAPTCDKMIRKWHGMEDNGKYASILVAFNTVKG